MENNNFRKIVMKTVVAQNQVDLQVKVLKELQNKRMTSSELRQFVEKLGKDYDCLLPLLKQTGLLKIEHSDGGRSWIYSVKDNDGHKKVTT